MSAQSWSACWKLRRVGLDRALPVVEGEPSAAPAELGAEARAAGAAEQVAYGDCHLRSPFHSWMADRQLRPAGVPGACHFVAPSDAWGWLGAEQVGGSSRGHPGRVASDQRFAEEHQVTGHLAALTRGSTWSARSRSDRRRSPRTDRLLCDLGPKAARRGSARLRVTRRRRGRADQVRAQSASQLGLLLSSSTISS